MMALNDLIVDITISFFVLVGCAASIACCFEVSAFRKEMKELDASIKHWEDMKAALDANDRRHVLPYD